MATSKSDRDGAHEDPFGELAGQVDNYRRQAERLGRLLSGRQLLECPNCGLHEDELADMTLVVVTGDVFDDGVSAAPALRNYLQVLGNVNRELAAMADEVVEVVVGIPVYRKGEKRA